MSEALVSIVVPVYNVEEYLNKCIESVTSQTYKNLEIIIVDDGSTDNCPAICDDWAQRDDRIKVIHKSNAGLGMARNTGMDNATGKYIFFVDSDDTIDVQTVEKCLNRAEETGAFVVAFYGCDVYDSGQIVRKAVPDCKRLFTDDEVKNEFLPGLFSYEFGLGVSSCMKMFDFDVLRELNIKYKSEREVISEDAFFILELLSKVSVAAIVPECLYYYYKRSNSLTKVFKEDRMEKNNVFLTKCLECIKINNLSSKVSEHIVVRYHLYSFEAMKQVLRSDLSDKAKKETLIKFFSDETLRSTLSNNVLNIHSGMLRMFFALLKNKMYNLCYLLLKLKVKG